jgi:hypothetical protein
MSRIAAHDLGEAQNILCFANHERKVNHFKKDEEMMIVIIAMMIRASLERRGFATIDKNK